MTTKTFVNALILELVPLLKHLQNVSNTCNRIKLRKKYSRAYISVQSLAGGPLSEGLFLQECFV